MCKSLSTVPDMWLGLLKTAVCVIVAAGVIVNDSVVMSGAEAEH